MSFFLNLSEFIVIPVGRTLLLLNWFNLTFLRNQYSFRSICDPSVTVVLSSWCFVWCISWCEVHILTYVLRESKSSSSLVTPCFLISCSSSGLMLEYLLSLYLPHKFKYEMRWGASHPFWWWNLFIGLTSEIPLLLLKTSCCLVQCDFFRFEPRYLVSYLIWAEPALLVPWNLMEKNESGKDHLWYCRFIKHYRMKLLFCMWVYVCAYWSWYKMSLMLKDVINWLKISENATIDFKYITWNKTGSSVSMMFLFGV